MHDCLKEDKLVDLVFDELDSRERSALIAELKSCHRCYSLYLSMDQTILTVDQVTKASLPAESYWTGYEEILKARLNDAARQTMREEMPGRSRFSLLLAMPRVARYGLAFTLLVVLSVAAFHLIRSRANSSELIAKETKIDSPDIDSERNAGARDVERGTIASRLVPAKPEIKMGVSRKLHVQPPETASRVPAARFDQQPSPASMPHRRTTAGSAFSGEVARHIEKAQLLLRSFRNLGPPAVGSELDVSYEKELSKELVSKNRLLRRSAERKQKVFVEELLSSIEPLLLDIANLADKPLQDDVRAIKDLMTKQEIVATLQSYSAKNSHGAL